jgi:hypothetical protein
MCINFYLHVDERIYLMARVGAGSRSFRGVQAVVLKYKKSPPRVPGVGSLTVPEGSELFIAVYYQ